MTPSQATPPSKPGSDPKSAPVSDSPPADLILASQSPRRGQLLTEHGYAITQISPPFADPDQPTDDTLAAERHATELAIAKARSLARTLDRPAVIIAADTLCVDQNDRLIGKPSDCEHAFAMLSSFVDARHAVVSGVAVLDCRVERDGVLHSFADRAWVRFGSIAPGAIKRYLELDQWQGKAGGYNLFDRQASGWPITVEGDETTVVGLPMNRLIEILDGLNIHRNTNDRL